MTDTRKLEHTSSVVEQSYQGHMQSTQPKQKLNNYIIIYYTSYNQ